MFNFQEAFLTAKDGDTIYIPPGKYIVDYPINWTGKVVHVKATGVMLVSSADVAITIGGEPGRDRWRGSVEGLWVYSSRYDWHKTNQPSTGIRFQNTCAWRLDGLSVYGFGTGVEFLGNNASNGYNTVTNPVITDCKIGLRATGTGKAGWANRTVVTGGSWAITSKIGKEAPDAVVTCVELVKPEIIPSIGSWVFFGPCWQAQRGDQTYWMDLKSAYLVDVYSPHCECADQKPGILRKDSKTWGINIINGVQTGIRL